MTNEALQNIIAALHENLGFSEEASQFLNVTVQKEDLLAVCSQLKQEGFDYLFCMTGIDYGKELGVIYHLEDTTNRRQLVLKVQTEDRENPTFDSVIGVWKTAELNEMEIFDFFGIRFTNHPNLKRLFLTPDWNGYPLRKDYVDEDNMVIK